MICLSTFYRFKVTNRKRIIKKSKSSDFNHGPFIFMIVQFKFLSGYFEFRKKKFFGLSNRKRNVVQFDVFYFISGFTFYLGKLNLSNMFTIGEVSV